jgi:hypothetical protein
MTKRIPPTVKITLRGTLPVPAPAPAGKVLARSEMLKMNTRDRAKFFCKGGRVVSNDLAPLLLTKPN